MSNANYTKADFEEAQTALLSTLHKCEKVQDSEKLGKSQRTLLDQRVRALRLALSLIEDSLADAENKAVTLKQGGALLVVKDMERSKAFYKSVLGLDVSMDFGANVTLSDCLSLQTRESWQKFIDNAPVTFSGNDAEIYFAADNFDGFIAKLDGVLLVHPPYEHSWGQRVVRFYDPDGHIVEVGENMTTVVKRFIDSGMTVAETATRMDVPERYITEQLEL